VISTGAVEAAARPMSFQISSIAADDPTIPLVVTGAARGRLRASSRCFTARAMAALSAGSSNGLVR
jgi:hypothetical protein